MEIFRILKELGVHTNIIVGFLVIAFLVKSFRSRRVRASRLNEHSLDSLLAAWTKDGAKGLNHEFVTEVLLVQRFGFYTPYPVAQLFLKCPSPYLLFSYYRLGRFIFENDSLIVRPEFRRAVSLRIFLMNFCYYMLVTSGLSAMAFVYYAHAHVTYIGMIIILVISIFSIVLGFLFLWQIDWLRDGRKLVEQIEALLPKSYPIRQMYSELTD